MERARPPADISPHDFFTRWIADAVASDPERRRRLADTDATIVFQLEAAREVTAEGSEAADSESAVFTVRIEKGRVEGRAGNSAESDLRVRVDVGTWRRLNAGETSAPQALLSRRVRLDGDFLLGLKLHTILG